MRRVEARKAIPEARRPAAPRSHHTDPSHHIRPSHRRAGALPAPAHQPRLAAAYRRWQHPRRVASRRDCLRSLERRHRTVRQHCLAPEPPLACRAWTPQPDLARPVKQLPRVEAWPQWPEQSPYPAQDYPAGTPRLSALLQSPAHTEGEPSAACSPRARSPVAADSTRHRSRHRLWRRWP